MPFLLLLNQVEGQRLVVDRIAHIVVNIVPPDADFISVEDNDLKTDSHNQGEHHSIFHDCGSFFFSVKLGNEFFHELTK